MIADRSMEVQRIGKLILVLASLALGLSTPTVWGVIEYHVDVISGGDDNEGLGRTTAFETIQRGIDVASDGDTVLVWPGTYVEEVRFEGMAITVRSADYPAVLEAPDDYAVSFYRGEGPGSILSNFVIRNSNTAVFVAGASPTIRNITVVDNELGIGAFAGSAPLITSSIFYNNEQDLFDCEAQHSWVSDQVEQQLQEGLVAHWSFDERQGTTAYDSADQNHGTVNGAQWVDGKLEGALSFDGGDASVMIEDSESLNANDALSISVWVKASAFSGDGMRSGNPIIKRWKTGPVCQFHLAAYTGGGLVFRFAREHKGEIVGRLVQVDNALTVDRWHHIVAERDGSGIKIYRDGVLMKKDFTNWGLLVNYQYEQQHVEIGHDSAWTDWHFSGAIDDVRLYGRALPEDDILLLQQIGLSNHGIGLVLPANYAHGDYHLLSERGRFVPEYGLWAFDEVTSPGVDGGDPVADVADERFPNGGRINMGAYGGTRYASLSSGIAGDNNDDGLVNMIDFAILANNWLSHID